MAANLLGVEPSAVALDQPACGEGDQQPHVDGTEHGDQETEPRRFRLIQGLVHGASILLLVVGVAAAQVAWMALLAYGVYRLGVGLPL